MMTPRLAWMGVLLLVLMGPAPARAQMAEAPGPGAIAGFLADARMTRLLVPADRLAELRNFYQARGYRPAWHDGRQWRPAALMAAQTLDQAWREGLNPADYLPGGFALPGPGDGQAALMAELRLSAGMLAWLRHVHYGRVGPGRLHPMFHTPPAPAEMGMWLETGLGAPGFAAWLAGLPPQSPQYAALRAELAAWHGRTVLDWPHLPTGGLVRPGGRDARMPVLRQALVAHGLLAPPLAEGPVMDAATAGALRAFQRAHGLKDDGILGEMTRTELNRGPAETIRRLAANMERIRWEWWPHPARYLAINIGDQSLMGIEDGLVTLEMRVIVGRPHDPTPLLTDKIANVLVNPTWTPPLNLARNEILPKLKQDAGWLGANNFRIFADWSEGAAELDPATIDWKSTSWSGFRYKVRQRAGQDSALGQMRFSLTNDSAIYMHDTPTKPLFAETGRVFSHGCMRVEDFRRLFDFVMKGSKGGDRETLEALLKSGETRRVYPVAALPVVVRYLTAQPAPGGGITWYPDVYGHDSKLGRMLLPAPPAGLQAAEN